MLLRLRTLGYWVLPSLLLIVLYSGALRSWFRMDDFAWLQLSSRVTDFDSLLSAVFSPQAQGTIRPVSERLFFMSLYSIFGVDSLPFRLIVFATQITAMTVLSLLTQRITGSAIAGFVAPILWILNANLFWSLSWSSAYNQVLCSLVFVSALFLFVRFVETGRRKYQVLHWAVFLFGFGVLELNVVYPAIAFAYALFFSRKHVANTIPMLGISALYAVIHRVVAPLNSVSAYKMHFDSSIFSTLWQYTRLAVSAEIFAGGNQLDLRLFYGLAGIVIATMLFFVAQRATRQDWLPFFFCIWFLLSLAPYLPLRNHVSDYYLTVPVLGLAMLGGYGVHLASKSPSRLAAAAIVLLAYGAPGAWAAKGQSEYVAAVTRRSKALIHQIAYAHQLHPDKTLLLRGVDSELFWAALYDRAYRLFGLKQVFLTADSEPLMQAVEDAGSISPHFMPETLAHDGIKSGTVIVYDTTGERMHNITGLYFATLEAKRNRQLPRYIDAGVPGYSEHLRNGWHQIETGFRWMARQAIVELGRPVEGNAVLRVSGTCPPQQLEKGPVTLTVSIDGHPYPPSTIDGSNEAFSFTYPITVAENLSPSLLVSLEVNRTLSVPGDPRDLGLIFGRFEVVPALQP